MITMITGLPGNGKTLYSIAWLRERAVKENRQVYYNGITDLRVPGWIELPDAEQWATLPTGAIVIVDEAQRIFRPRMHGKNVPDFVAALETHRHLGIDLVFITQHPMLIDSNVRRLCGQHFHVIRKFGTHWATIHEWGKCKETCDKNREDSVRLEWKFPAEVFALYKSAELHTHKRRIPFKVIFLLCMPLILGALGWYAWYRLDPARAKERAQLEQLANAPSAGTPQLGAGAAKNGPLSPADWAALQQPRIPGLAYTAAAYDQVTTPVEAPVPAACVATAARCRCYSQQATQLDVPDALCRKLVEAGFFMAWRTQPAPTGSNAPRDPPSGPQSAVPVVAPAAPLMLQPERDRRPLVNRKTAPA